MASARKHTIIGVIGGVLLSLAAVNYPPVSWLIGPKTVSYASGLGGFTFMEDAKSHRDYQTCQWKWKEYKKTGATDTLLFRITPINYWECWHWRAYLTQPQFKLPYKDWNEIRQRRAPLKNKTGFQDF